MEGLMPLNLITVSLTYFDPLYKDGVFSKGSPASIYVITSLTY